ncbi:guanine deaminase [Enhygromyxa salina]|uniref:Guanine deaminase n=1 Tax=Enhygromyxa salina TaxID=215803 RepID=A0A2S9YUR6_9BACT|nr:guanine deaminase [Enhygromyxa salina]PRQ08847.1 Guanine deaminase [Enhygromyxa salina]
MTATLQTIRGCVLAPDPDHQRVSLLPDALLRIDDAGVIVSVEAASADCDVPNTWPGAVIVPGFVDVHLHFPQTRVIGSASGPLLPWLERSVFPEEQRFADDDYAATVADEFCDALIAQGTTCAAIYSSSHPGATERLFAALARRGLRAATGLTLMDRHGPAALVRSHTDALAASEGLLERWHGYDRGRLQLSMIPRFAISCTPELMQAAGTFAASHDLLIQSHISENLDEIAKTLELFPGQRDYLGVYEAHGCATASTILAHCIHLSDHEWSRFVSRDLAIAHCPDSNFFLGSGAMPLAAALDRGLRVGLGTDVGAGRTFSVRRVAAAAHDAALLHGAPVAPQALLWLATRGGARALGRPQLGCVAPGFEADLAVIDLPALGSSDMDTIIDALLFRHDAGPVRATLVRGRVL